MFVIKGLKMKLKKHQVVIRNINVYLNKEQEKVWNELPELYTNSQRIEHLINFYIKHNKGDNENE